VSVFAILVSFTLNSRETVSAMNDDFIRVVPHVPVVATSLSRKVDIII